MDRVQRRSWLHFLLLIPLSLGLIFPASSQAAAGSLYTINITSLTTDDFPRLHLHFSPRDAEDSIVPNLTIDNVHVLEDGVSRQLDRMVMLEPGLQVILALNPGPALNYYVGGKTRMENLLAALQGFLGSQAGHAADDFSLVTASEPLVSRAGDPGQVNALLSDYHPAWSSITPSLESLDAALDLASSRNPGPDMQRVILYITPIVGENSLPELQALTTRAANAGVHVFVWLVAYSSSAFSQEAGLLEELAHRTNGEYFLFTGMESLPDPSRWFDPFRYFYSAEYVSQIDQSGTHALAVVMQTPAGEITSPVLSFDLVVSAPEISFINVPESISRTEIADQPLEELRLDYLIQFPDGYSRDIQSVSLFVDGEQTLTDVDEPFDYFLWSPPVDPLAESHTLQLSVTDRLGLSFTSPERILGITLQTAPQTRIQLFFTNLKGTRLIILVAVLISAAALVTVLILSGRGYRLKFGKGQSRKDQRDPCKQQVAMGIEAAKQPGPSSAPGKNGLRVSTHYAQLVPLTSAGQTNTLLKPFPLFREEHVIGSDGKQADIQVKSTSVEPVHSRIKNKADLGFFVSDCHTKSGTWVNYAPVSEAGTRLEHNDIITFGKITYRFEVVRQSGGNPS